jgi:hypothetical protein
MIEYRAMLRKNLKFEGGYKLDAGTIIYVRETVHGWLGTHYEPKGTGHGFALDDDAFSVLQSSDCQVQELVVMPDPPAPPEDIERQRQLARRRLEHQIKKHRETADELEQLLEEH